MFFIVRQNGKQVIAALQFHVQNKVARSPAKAPFGSVECRNDLNPKLLFRFLQWVELRLKEKGVSEIYIKNPPRAYAPQKLSLVETFLLNQKFVVYEAEAGAVITVIDRPFHEGIRPSEILRRRQAQQAGFRFERLALEECEEVYQFISGCHSEKGYEMSMTREALLKTVRKFPERYFLFAVIKEEKIVAAAVSILVKKHILYNFIVNHEKSYNQWSPPVLLMEGIYEFCRHNGIGLLDLGTSALEGAPKFTLLDFKLRMGGVPTSKLTFYKRTG